jgi:hypothetical protein
MEDGKRYICPNANRCTGIYRNGSPCGHNYPHESRISCNSASCSCFPATNSQCKEFEEEFLTEMEMTL